jgi:hypothetical protein
MTTNDGSDGVITIANEQQFEDAYARLEPAMKSLKPDELVQINLDVPAAVATILGVVPKLRALRPEIALQLPGFDLVRFDSLEDCAFALSYAHTNYLTASQPPDVLPPLAADALKMREVLLATPSRSSRTGSSTKIRSGSSRAPTGSRTWRRIFRV